MAELASEALGEEVSVHTSLERLVALAKDRGVDVHATWGSGRVLAECSRRPARSRSGIQSSSPTTRRGVALSRRHQVDSELTERFESYAATRELSNGFSELIDPLDQRARFEEQARLAAAEKKRRWPSTRTT